MQPGHRFILDKCSHVQGQGIFYINIFRHKNVHYINIFNYKYDLFINIFVYYIIKDFILKVKFKCYVVLG